MPRRLKIVQPRPRTRGECADGPRPCPWLGCRHHLALDVQAKGPQVQKKALRAMQYTCSLDAAEQSGGMEVSEVAKHFGLTTERVRQIEAEALGKLRKRLKNGDL